MARTSYYIQFTTHHILKTEYIILCFVGIGGYPTPLHNNPPKSKGGKDNIAFFIKSGKTSIFYC